MSFPQSSTAVPHWTSSPQVMVGAQSQWRVVRLHVPNVQVPQLTVPPHPSAMAPHSASAAAQSAMVFGVQSH
jgi:hypothetical protein